MRGESGGRRVGTGVVHGRPRSHEGCGAQRAVVPSCQAPMCGLWLGVRSSVLQPYVRVRVADRRPDASKEKFASPFRTVVLTYQKGADQEPPRAFLSMRGNNLTRLKDVRHSIRSNKIFR